MSETMSALGDLAISLADIEAAAERIKGVAVETPLLESAALNERLGARILIKPETLQRVGAFKFRGAYNRLVQLTSAERAKGVVAFSSGNHAQGVALAAKLLGIPALIVMPSDAPKVKAEATRAYGAEIKFYDDTLKSLHNGERTGVQPTRRTLCDALETPIPGELTFPILLRTVADIGVVTDAEVAEAMRYAFSVLKLVVEPGGSAGLAALLAGKVKTFGATTIGVVLSGGNVDPDQFAQVLRREL